MGRKIRSILTPFDWRAGDGIRSILTPFNFSHRFWFIRGKYYSYELIDHPMAENYLDRFTVFSPDQITPDGDQ
jgi:hypothetical protein